MKPSTEHVQIEKRLYSISEIQKATGLGRTTIYTLMNKGQLQGVKIGKRRLVKAESLEKFLSALNTVA